jgi:hypothetical protein
MMAGRARWQVQTATIYDMLIQYLAAQPFEAVNAQAGKPVPPKSLPAYSTLTKYYLPGAVPAGADEVAGASDSTSTRNFWPA